MMEECGNEEQDDNNENETAANINNMNESEGTCVYITPPDMMVE